MKSPPIDKPANQISLELAQQLSQAGTDVSQLDISINGDIVKLHNDIPKHSQINAEQAEIINQALNNPANQQGTIKITQANQVLLHVENGMIKSDMLNLTQQAAKTKIKSPTKALYEQASARINDHSVKNMKQIAAKAIELGAEPKMAMTMLRSHNPAYQGISNTKGKVVADRIAAKAVSRSFALAQTQSHSASKSRQAAIKDALAK